MRHDQIVSNNLTRGSMGRIVDIKEGDEDRIVEAGLPSNLR